MPAYQICTKTVMDNSADPDIRFDEDGVCNYYHLYRSRVERFVIGGERGEQELQKLFDRIRKEGEGKPYDCITGISGGVDSTYMVYLCKKYGLRPLLVHLDNGWNSEIANQNINNIIDRCGYDLHTHVIDWDEFRDLQIAFLKASVIDLELTSDHAIFAVITRLAQTYKINYMLNGFNITTEGILPESWRWYKYDWLNIKSIHKAFGTKSLKTYPHLGFSAKLYADLTKRVQSIQPLNYIDYNKEEAQQVIAKELGWRNYGGKHFESIITRFYQGYILPEKYGVDKRRAHLSTLIASGQITRDEALQELKNPIYDPKMLAEDKTFVLKKLELSPEEFSAILATPARPHTDFDSYITKHFHYHERIMKSISPMTRLVKRVMGISSDSGKKAYH